ncbi:hypothetical protein SAMN05216238_107142 [Lentibacillus persicus]|uniref:ABC-2 type transport system permease protein n=1 Tax=Lentibacillus persicus TaxID=640948 RepID=A0A1I1X9Y0_9BACI|nr:hypothetical protein [Lentibacillus persicus]SFE03448.1 hypothetical protein SAMN05216238_107142 [Lentibacillus persicus]
MNKKTFFPKVAFDMFTMQMVWSLYFLGSLLAVHIMMVVLAVNINDSIGDFLFFSHGSAKIYMLVIGIISTYGFLTHFAHHGVTRKDYFKGAFIAAIGVALAIAVIAAAVTGIEYVMIEMTGTQDVLERSLSAVDITSNSISVELPDIIFQSSVLLHGTNWVASLFLFSLNVLTYFAAGWLIGSGFYRFGWVIGLGFIVLSLLFMVTGDLIWGIELGEPLSNWLPFSSISLPFYVSFLYNLIMIGVMLVLIRLAIRHTPIKM